VNDNHPKLGNLLETALRCHHSGNLSGAWQYYDEVLGLDSSNIHALTGLGTIALQQDKLQLGLKLLKKSLELDSTQSNAWSNHALALSKIHRHKEAIQDYDKAIVLNQNFANAWNNRGLSLQHLGLFKEALESFDRAISINPDYAEAYANRAATLKTLGFLRKAVKNYDKAISLKPNNALTHFNKAVLLQELQKFEEALTAYNTSISLNSNFSEAYNNLGILLKLLDRPEDAIANLMKATLINPKNTLALANLGSIFQNLNRLDDALVSYNKAIEINPAYADAYVTKAEVLLSKGDYLSGWELFEWRWRSQFRKEKFEHPIWDGVQDIRNKSLLVLPEAGYGDFIMFSRFVPLVLEKGAKITLVVPPPLFSLYSENGWGVDVVQVGDGLPSADFVCPIMSFPRAFKTNLFSIPNAFPYLSVPQKKSSDWHKKLVKSTEVKIGLVWSGNLNRNIDKNLSKRRRMPLEMLDALLKLPFEFHSLQKEMADQDVAILSNYPRLINHQIDLTDFSDTAALINELDLVITIDTSVAHLVGALGKLLWVMLPYSSDYRWEERDGVSPWYPNAKIFRQREIGNWSEVLEEVQSELQIRFGRGQN